MDKIRFRQECIEQGQAFFDKREYAIALAFFQRSQELGNDDASVNCTIGDCMYFLSTSGYTDKHGKQAISVDDPDQLRLAIVHIERALNKSSDSTRYLQSMNRALIVQADHLDMVIETTTDELEGAYLQLEESQAEVKKWKEHTYFNTKSEDHKS